MGTGPSLPLPGPPTPSLTSPATALSAPAKAPPDTTHPATEFLMRAIILAGGKGTRLRPSTITLPKPLVPVGGEMPIIEVIIRQLARAGFERLTFAVNHKANLIRAFCGDGAQWKVRIDYSEETEPLSTIGPLTLIDDLPEDFLVMNGDLLCNLDYAAFFRHHIAQH